MSAAGKRTERIQFVVPRRTKVAGGGYEVTRDVLGEVWADVRPVAATESEKQGRRFGSTTYMVEIHADDKPEGLTTAAVIVWLTGGNVEMNVRAVRQAAQSVQTLELVGETGVVTGPGV